MLDRKIGMVQASRMLLLLGCKRVVALNGAPFGAPDDKLRGILAGFASLGARLTGEDVIAIQTPGSPGYQEGYAAVAALLRTRYVDGLLCCSDAIAIGAMRALREANVRVPDDVKVVGFNDVPVAEYQPVSLSTVRHPLAEVAVAAIEKTRTRLQDYEAPETETTFATTLILRESAPVADHALRRKIFDSGGAP